MTKKITIAIDAMGGDNSPDKTINGVKLFLEKNNSNKDFLLYLYGDEEKINNRLIKYKVTQEFKNMEILNDALNVTRIYIDDFFKQILKILSDFVPLVLILIRLFPLEIFPEKARLIF